MVLGSLNICNREHSGAKHKVTQYLALKMATDSRSRNGFMPPRTHLGVTIPPADDPKALVHALDVARLGYAYLAAMVREASALPPHV